MESAPSDAAPITAFLKCATVVAIAMAVAACSNGGAPSPFDPTRAEGRETTSTPIQHVVFIIQENRSFNNLFMGYPGALTQNYGYDESGDKIVLHSQTLSTGWDIDHSSVAFFSACDGQGSLPGTDCKMDGWNNELAGLGHPANFAYAYTPRSEIKPYWTIAHQYVLADHMFQSQLDGSFIAHQYAVAAYASRSVDSPLSDWGCSGGKPDTIETLTDQRTYGPAIVACYDNPTLGIAADKAGVTWRFYSVSYTSDDGGIWSAYWADHKVFYGPDWSTDVINPPSQFLTDVGAGTLANITWITPTNATSDHPGLVSSAGPAWVASVVNAIGKSKFWNSTAIFIIWDDWGGWFDPVPPVFENYDGLGFRVGMLIVSPYAKQGYVTHVQYETASVLRYMEDNFGLPHLAQADKRANDPASDAFDYTQQPRKFKTIPGSKPTSYWKHLERLFSTQKKRGAIIGSD
jgi:phospholipase C